MSLELHNVTIKINSLPRYLEEIILFENFNLEIQQGEVSTIMGPSGSGKSTLISYICGISEKASVSGTKKINNNKCIRIHVLCNQTIISFLDF